MRRGPFAIALGLALPAYIGVGECSADDIPSPKGGEEHRSEHFVSLEMAQIPAGVHEPFILGKNDLKQIDIQEFQINRAPITNRRFLEFVRASPEWRKSSRKRMFADDLYLSHWVDDLTLPDGSEDEPVVYVSWFAAKAYCATQGGRLPTVAEWEYVAVSDEASRDGRRNPESVKRLLEIYSKPAPARLPNVESMRPNYYGVKGMHGVIWEWTSDFNSMLVTGESRGDSSLERDLYCGSGAANVSEAAKVNYPAFLRSGFRSSLQGNYCIHNLGFRCVLD